MNYTKINWRKLNTVIREQEQLSGPYPIEVLKKIPIVDDASKYDYAAKLASIVFDKTVTNDVDVSYKWPFTKTWLDKFCNNNGTVRERVRQWLVNVRVLDAEAVILFHCANKNIGAARLMVRKMAQVECSLSDPSFFLQNLVVRRGEIPIKPDLAAIFLGEVDLENEPGAAQLISLFKDAGEVDLIFDNLSVDEIKSIGGWRTVTLGLNLTDLAEVEFWEDSNYYDIGGGYSTPVVSASTEKPFITLDIIKPTDFIDQMTLRRFDKLGTVPLNDAERIGYVRRLKEQPYKLFNFDTQPFPDHDKISLVSCGSYSVEFGMSPEMEEFVTNEHGLELRRNGNKLYGAFRMLKLIDYISKGRDLEIAMCSRIPRNYLKNRLTYFRWENGYLVDFKSNQHSVYNFSYKWKHNRWSMLAGRIRKTPEFNIQTPPPWPLKFWG